MATTSDLPADETKISDNCIQHSAAALDKENPFITPSQDNLILSQITCGDSDWDFVTVLWTEHSTFVIGLVQTVNLNSSSNCWLYQSKVLWSSLQILLLPRISLFKFGSTLPTFSLRIWLSTSPVSFIVFELRSKSRNILAGSIF